MGPGQVAQAGSQVDRPAQVVVALEDQDVARGHPGSQRETAAPADPLLDAQHRPHDGLGVDAHEHRPVAQPLVHPDTAQRLYWAAAPLITRLSYDQKQAVKQIALSMGLTEVAQAL